MTRAGVEVPHLELVLVVLVLVRSLYRRRIGTRFADPLAG